MVLERHYDHRYHAGNVGDVWKHVALLALLARTAPPRRFVDTHAGAGAYSLGPTGEWTEGVGRLRASGASPMPAAVARYLERVGHRARYPGSPAILRAEMAEDDHLDAFELDAATFAELSRNTGGDPRVTLENTDGLGGLERVLESDRGGAVIALIDPPYADRKEWQLVPESLARAHAVRGDAQLAVWYPIKSYARPNAMLAALEKAGVPATAIELITSPLTSKKNRLNGSGVLVVNAPAGLLEELAAIAVWLGPRLSAADGFFTVRCVGLQRGTPRIVGGQTFMDPEGG